MNENADRFLPLSPAALHMLLALAGEDLHGYAIMQEVKRGSEGTYKLSPGTLYDNLQKLMCEGLVQQIGRRRGDSDPRRIYYRLAPLGRRVLAAEATRLQGVLRETKLRLGPVKLRRA